MAFDFLKKITDRAFRKNKKTIPPSRSTQSKSLQLKAKDSLAPVAKQENETGKEVISGVKGKSDVAPRVLIAPHVSEKSSYLQNNSSYVFKVSKDANKNLLKKAVEERYNVKVRKVNMVNVPGKERRRGMVLGHKPGYKKAIVTLNKGDVIETF